MAIYMASSGFAARQHILDALLLPGERVICVAEISAFIYWKSAATFAAALVLLFYAATLGIYAAAVGVALFFLAWSGRKYLLLAATDRRLLVRGGILNENIIQLPYEAVESLRVSRLPMARMFGYGSIILSGRGQQTVIVPYVKNMAAFEAAVAGNMGLKEKTAA